MNKTELLAHNWLIAEGYTGLVFRSNKTPDFLTEQGLSFEIKRLRNGTIWFSRDQFNRMLGTDNSCVLVFSNNSTPDAIISIEDLRLHPKIWKNIKILVPDEFPDHGWVKIWVEDILNGTILAQGTLEDLGFLTSMICLATKCRGDYGWIQANPECAFSHQWIANRITGGDLQKFDMLLQKMIKEERLIEDENRGIFICNMEYYQITKGAKETNNNGNKNQDKHAGMKTE